MSDALGDLPVNGCGGLGLSPDDGTLAIGTKGVVLWNLADRKTMGAPLAHQTALDLGFVNCAVFSPDGKTLAAHTYDGTFKLWDVATWQELVALDGYGSHFGAVAFSPDGTLVAVPRNKDLTVTVWDTSALCDGRGDNPVTTLTGHSEEINFVAFSPDGAKLASGGNDTTISNTLAL